MQNMDLGIYSYEDGGDYTNGQDGKTWVDHPFKSAAQDNCQPRTEWNPGVANQYHMYFSQKLHLKSTLTVGYFVWLKGNPFITLFYIQIVIFRV